MAESRLDVLIDVMRVPTEGDVRTALVATRDARPAESLEFDLVVVGGGTGGVAAALSAAAAGRHVCLLEETDWIGGQLTSQGVSALDEHEHIERFGGTASYYRLREAIRDRYRPLARDPAALDPFNPGNCWVTRLAFEPLVAVEAMEEMLRPHVEAGRLRILRRHKAFAAETSGGRIESVTALSLADGSCRRLAASHFVDATELGELLPLTGTAFIVGAESQAQTGEAHAQPEEPKSRCVQSFTYIVGVERRPRGEHHIIPAPTDYETYRQTQPYSLTIEVHGGEIYGEESGWLAYRLYDRMPGTKGGLWDYRRLVDSGHFPSFEHDLTIFNWPGNDYRDSSILEGTPEEVARGLQAAKRVSLGFLRWLQIEAPATRTQQGAPEIALQPAIMGSADGLSKYPYIRESRRILALKTVVEEEVSAHFQPGPRAAHFADSVGIGWYPIDIHRSGPEDVGVSCRTRPFQIPLGALLPQETSNLVAACKSIGTTHITNGCYRLHPVEWNLGEVAGLLAAEVLDQGCSLRQLRDEPDRLARFQARLLRAGVPLAWLLGFKPGEPGFAASQRLFMAGRLDGGDDLDLRLDAPTSEQEWRAWGGKGAPPSTRGQALAALDAADS